MITSAVHSFSTGSTTPPDPLKSNNNDDYDDKQIDVAVTQKQPGFDMVSQSGTLYEIGSTPHDRAIDARRRLA